MVRVVNETRGVVLAERAELADTFLPRFLGLMGRRELPDGAGMVLVPCNGVHNLFVRFPIDVLHLDREGIVLRQVTPLYPWRLGPVVRGGYTTVELPAGTAQRSGTCDGDRIVLAPL